MDNKNKIAAAVIICVLLLCAAVIPMRGIMTSDNKTAVIYQNGEIIREIELDKITEPIEFDITSDSHKNRIRAERGRIRVISADCPDKVCVNQGWIKNGAVPIVCLPHKITIEIKGGAEQIDAVAGGM